ncbi:MAG: DnaD domain protein [Christensenellales bacterium]
MQLKLKYHSTGTLVPNRFIENCVNAPDKFISVYLLTLKYASVNGAADIDILCARLGMTKEYFFEVFEYWQKKGFMRIINDTDMRFEFGDFTPSVLTEDELYTEREFNQMLQNLFGSRQLSPHDYIRIYDYTDMFGLGKKVVLALVEYCIMQKGRRVSLSYIDKVAQAWSEEGHITTEEQAREFIAQSKAASMGVTRVLKQLGLSNRTPTKDETELFEKWTRDWGFTLDAVLTACSQTTAAREPSFKYLDRILQRLYTRGLITSRTITESNIKNEDMSISIKEVMHLAGEVSLKLSFEQESLYQKWTNVYGFDQRLIVFAAKNASLRGKNPFISLDGVLTDWYNNHVTTITNARRYLAAQQSLNERIMAVFETAGINKTPTEANRKVYMRWNETWGIGHDAILLAAEISTLSDNPYRYLNSILSNWHSAGIKSLADAQRDAKKNAGGSPAAAKAAYFDRPTENYDHLALNPFADGGA